MSFFVTWKFGRASSLTLGPATCLLGNSAGRYRKQCSARVPGLWYFCGKPCRLAALNGPQSYKNRGPFDRGRTVRMEWVKHR